MHAIDFCADSTLIPSSRELGFDAAFPAARVTLASGSQVSQLQSHRERVLSLESPNPEFLKMAVMRPRHGALTLINPFLLPAAPKEDGLIRAVAERGKEFPVAFHLPLRALLMQSFVSRAKHLFFARAFLVACKKRTAPVILSSMATTPLELKSPREHLAIATSLYGLTVEESQAMLSRRPRALIERAGIPIQEMRG